MAEKRALSKLFFVALGVGLLVISSKSQTALAVATPDYYHCVAKVTGEFNFGRAPMACNASSFGDDGFVQNQFAPLIFVDTASRVPERERYSQEMNGVLRDAATYYMKKRKPAVTTTELNWWITLVQTTASHESYWSHYRKASDARIKLMRGDSGHGHGMMQIDDRAHFPAITNGTAWNLIGNLTYAMDLLYPYWQKAPTLGCVKNEMNYEARIRSAWSAYNGGENRLCRWTNPTDRWAENDRNFYQHLTSRPYEKFVGDKLRAASINIPCLMEKRENCPPAGPPSAPGLQQGVLYQTNTGLSCVINNERAFCVAEVRDAICLNSITGFTGKAATMIEASALAKYSPSTVDRHRLCSAYEPTLIGVGTSLETQQMVNLRSTPGGGLLTSVPARQTLEVLDFELRNAPNNDRYYKVRYNGTTGYIFGGDTDTSEQWAISSRDSAYATLAKAGEMVRIKNAAGINLRGSPGGAFIIKVPVRAELQVLGVIVQGAENGVYYKVKYGNNTGYIYSGLLMPMNTTSEWTEVLR